MGFIHDIRRILKTLPKQRQNLMFSATFSDDIRQLAKTIVNDPVEISVTPRNSAAVSVTQWVHPVDKDQKRRLLAELIKTHNWEQVLVFSRTKHGANRIAEFLDKNNIQAAAIHGNKSQGARTRALADFKSGNVRVLVATDIAARGLDIEQLPQVVNVDLPEVAQDYVHRIGRTGRAGATGQAISLVSADELHLLQDIERLTQKLLPRSLVEGYEPKTPLPESTLRPPAKPKKPKKPQGERSASQPSAHQPDQRSPGGNPANRRRSSNKKRGPNRRPQ
jgi:ATP-dependent RNA helicase RhlE